MSALLVLPPERRERWLLDSILFCTMDISSSVIRFEDDEVKSRLVRKLPLFCWDGFSCCGSIESFSQLYLRCLSSEELADDVDRDEVEEGTAAATWQMENDFEQSIALLYNELLGILKFRKFTYYAALNPGNMITNAVAART